jgi:peptide/nickel transport system substrate-binding protein
VTTPTTHREAPATGRSRRIIAAVASLALLGLAVLVGGSTAASAASPTTLEIASDTQLSTFNPFISIYDGELNIINSIYPALTISDAHNNPSAYLATSWKRSSDDLTWTFTIRKGLKWSDGTPITAQDIYWTYHLVMTNDVAATANGSLVANFKSVSAPNDTTFVINTKTPQANILYLSIPVVPAHVWKSRVADLKSNLNTDFPVVGYGPWILTGYKTDQYATMTANKSFYMGAPKFDKLISYYYKSSDASVAALKSGSLQQNALITATEYNALKTTKGVKTYQSAPVGWQGIEINPGAHTKTGKPMGTGNPILADKRVRTAIAYAINRKTLVDKVLDGLGQEGAGYIPSGFPQWAWQPTAAQRISYNPAKANQILDAAGYTKGSGGVRVDPKTHKPLTFRLGIHSDETTDGQIAPYLQGWMQAIGIKLTIEPQSFSALNAALAKGDWDILMDGWSTGADPTYLMSIQTCAVLPQDNAGKGGNTDAFFCDKQYDKLFGLQQSQFNQTERATTIRKMQSILYDANVDIMLYYQDQLAAVDTTKVANYTFGGPNAQGIYLHQNPFYDWRVAKPVAASSSGTSSNTGLFIGIGIAVVVVVAVAALLVVRRRSPAADRE